MFSNTFYIHNILVIRNEHTQKSFAETLISLNFRLIPGPSYLSSVSPFESHFSRKQEMRSFITMTYPRVFYATVV